MITSLGEEGAGCCAGRFLSCVSKICGFKCYCVLFLLVWEEGCGLCMRISFRCSLFPQMNTDS